MTMKLMGHVVCMSVVSNEWKGSFIRPERIWPVERYVYNCYIYFKLLQLYIW